MDKPPKPNKDSREIFGDPFDMGSNPSVPKAREAIQEEKAGGLLCGQERKLLNFLLAVAYPELTTATRHYVTTADVRNYLGLHESNDRVKAIIRKLGRIIPDVDFLDGNGEERGTFGGLLFGSVPKGEGRISYFFHPDLVPCLNKPAVFARIKLAILGQFVSKYAPVIYEHLELYANRGSKVWDIAVDDFRSILGLSSKMKVFTELRTNVITPSIREINDKADFTVSVEEIRAEKGKGRKVERLIFKVFLKPEREAEEAELRHKLHGPEGPLKLPNNRDTVTPDIFDGRNDKERGSAPLLSPWALDEARALFVDFDNERPDIYKLEQEWIQYESLRTEKVRNPDKAFIGWCKRYRENRKKFIR